MLVRLRDDGKCAFEFLDSPPMRPTTSAQWLICFTAGGDRANFTQIHHQNFDISFLGVKLHYILGGIQMDLCL